MEKIGVFNFSEETHDLCKKCPYFEPASEILYMDNNVFKDYDMFCAYKRVCERLSDLIQNEGALLNCQKDNE